MPQANGSKGAVGRAFGSENRDRLIRAYLAEKPDVSAENAWQRVYELLLWIDRTTGLAHCYESDKCQPGRPWYARSLAFHDWLASEFSVRPADLGRSLDWLFRSAIEGLARGTHQERLEAAAKQRRGYDERGFPIPGEDRELVKIVSEVLGSHMSSQPSDQEWNLLTERIQTHLGQENKRKNLLGEGFEDTLAAVVRRLPSGADFQIANRSHLGDIPGFNPQSDVEKRKRVDLALWSHDSGRRILVTSKWSVRADREEQFTTDFDAYVRVNAGRPFDYVLVTNEFDAARLKAACDRLAGNSPLFTAVVHVNPDGVLAAYGSSGRGAAASLPELISSRRIISLEEWLTSIST